MCFLIPYIQNITIVANSFTLVMIAFDRYLAVTNCIKEKWQPGLIHSVVICTFIWIFAGLIASGALWNYNSFVVYIVKQPPLLDNGFSDYIYKAHMCSAEKLVNRKYYTLVFACVFTPTTLVFIMLNSIIAKRIWDRRRPLKNINVASSNSSASGGGNVNGIIRSKASSNETNTTSLEGNYRKVTAVSGSGELSFVCLSFFCANPLQIHSSSVSIIGTEVIPVNVVRNGVAAKFLEKS